MGGRSLGVRPNSGRYIICRYEMPRYRTAAETHEEILWRPTLAPSIHNLIQWAYLRMHCWVGCLESRFCGALASSHICQQHSINNDSVPPWRESLGDESCQGTKRSKSINLRGVLAPPSLPTRRPLASCIWLLRS